MPELPEIEILKQSLEKKVKHKIIDTVLVKNPNLRFKIHLTCPVSYFKRTVTVGYTYSHSVLKIYHQIIFPKHTHLYRI